MMGCLDKDQGRFFYEYRPDDLVPSDHLVRKLDAVLDLSGLRAELRPFYSHTGRPSIDPELMLRMLIVGYVFAIFCHAASSRIFAPRRLLSGSRVASQPDQGHGAVQPTAPVNVSMPFGLRLHIRSGV